MRMRFSVIALFVSLLVGGIAYDEQETTSASPGESGNVYGVTEAGGATGCGTVFEIEPWPTDFLLL